VPSLITQAAEVAFAGCADIFVGCAGVADAAAAGRAMIPAMETREAAVTARQRLIFRIDIIPISGILVPS
jgi:hypothetical protein